MSGLEKVPEESVSSSGGTGEATSFTSSGNEAEIKITVTSEEGGAAKDVKDIGEDKVIKGRVSMRDELDREDDLAAGKKEGDKYWEESQRLAKSFAKEAILRERERKVNFEDSPRNPFDQSKEPSWVSSFKAELADNRDEMAELREMVKALATPRMAKPLTGNSEFNPAPFLGDHFAPHQRDPFTPRGSKVMKDRVKDEEHPENDETMRRGVGSDKVTVFNGESKHLISFLSELRLTFSLAPFRYNDDRIKVMFTLKHMSGRAATWRDAFLSKPLDRQPIFMDKFEYLVQALTATFGATDLERQAVRDMQRLKQTTSASKFLTDFQVLALQSGYEEDRALIDMARVNLKDFLQDALAVDRTIPEDSFTEWMKHVIELDNRLFARETEKNSARKGQQNPATVPRVTNTFIPTWSKGPTNTFIKGRAGNAVAKRPAQNTQVGGPYVPLTEEQKAARLADRKARGLCTYCGLAGHFRKDCKKAQSNVPAGSANATQPLPGKTRHYGAPNGVVKGRGGRVIGGEEFWVDMDVKDGDVTVGLGIEVPGINGMVEVRGLIDNGASSNIISPDFDMLPLFEVKEYRFPKPLKLLDGSISGHEIEQYVDIALVLHPKVSPLVVRFDISPVDEYPILLGLDFFVKYAVLMDFGNSRFSIYQDGVEPSNLYGENEIVKLRYTVPAELDARAYAEEFRNLVDDDDDVVETKELLKTVPVEYHDFLDVFRKSHYDSLPPNRDYDMPITLLPNAVPKRGSPYPLNEAADKWLKAWIDKSLANGQIEPSEHWFGSPVFLVAKKIPGEFRMVTDFRKLNDATVKNAYPLPRINTLIERLRDATIFSKFDMPTSYQLLRVRPGDEKWTTILTRYGAFQSKVVREGLSNAGACFQFFLNDIFNALLDKGVIIYIDDILVYSRTKEEHVETCKEVFRILQKHSLYLKAAKCDFNKDRIGFLGFVISNGQVTMEETKLEAVRDWPAPKTVKEVQKFLGFANFYRRFIYGFAGVTRPLTALTRKSRPWQWGKEEIEAFEKLKTSFTSAPILRQFDDTRVCFLETDASDFAIAGVLSQRFDGHPGDTGFDGDIRPIGFYSCRLNPIGEINYTVHDKELLAILRCLREWRHLLIGSPYPIVVITDHRNLEYFNERRELSSRQARWAQFLADYRLEIRFRPGSEGGKPDSLSRRADYKTTSDKTFKVWNEASKAVLLPKEIFSETVKGRRGVTVDKNFNGVGNSTMLTDMERFGFSEEDIRGGMAVAILPIKGISDYGWERKAKTSMLTYKGKMVVPDNDFAKYSIVSARHDSILAGHVGRDKTLDLVWRDYYWPSARAYIENYVATCEHCQRTKSMRHKPYGMLKPIQVATRPWKEISFDLIEGLPISDGFTDILVVVDRFTKMAHFVACDNSLTAEKLAGIMLKEVFLRHGLPDRIVSDRGSEFASKLWKEVLKRLSVSRDLSTAFHPQTDGQTERVNQTLEHFIRHYCNYQQDDWNSLLPMAEFSYNNSKHSATNQSPFFVAYGYNPRFEVQGAFANAESFAGAALATSWESRWKEIEEQQVKAQEKMKVYYDKHRAEPPSYKVGDLVWVDAKNIRTDRPTKKLEDKRIGPLPITEKISTHAYRVKLPKGLLVHDVFSIDLLELFKKNDNPLRPKPPGRVVESPGEEIYEVEEVVGSRVFRGVLQYRVQWKGYHGVEKSTWEKIDEDSNFFDAIREFHARYPGRPGEGLYGTIKGAVNNVETERRPRRGRKGKTIGNGGDIKEGDDRDRYIHERGTKQAERSTRQPLSKCPSIKTPPIKTPLINTPLIKTPNQTPSVDLGIEEQQPRQQQQWRGTVRRRRFRRREASSQIQELRQESEPKDLPPFPFSPPLARYWRLRREQDEHYRRRQHRQEHVGCPRRSVVEVGPWVPRSFFADFRFRGAHHQFVPAQEPSSRSGGRFRRTL